MLAEVQNIVDPLTLVAFSIVAAMQTWNATQLIDIRSRISKLEGQLEWKCKSAKDK